MKLDNESILQILTQVVHPEKKKDIVSLGMISSVKIENNTIAVDILLQKANDPFATAIRRNSQSMLEHHYGKGVSVIINILQPQKKTEETSLNSLSGIKNIIAVSSGKGGVGKSTIAVNLAVATALTGAKVGLLDADIYGPSTPLMFGAPDYKPFMEQEGSIQQIVPLEKYGVKLLSIGFFVDPSSPVMWRGPMASNALRQLIHQSKWGELDYLFIDMPPGTGDIHISIVQEMPVTGAVIVSTPQKVALADVIKGIGMFRSENVNVPVLGLVENMSWFTPAELPDNKYYLFGKEGCRAIAEQYSIPLLGQIPIVQSIAEAGDNGIPPALDSHSIVGKAFNSLAIKLIDAVRERNKKLPPTSRVEMKK